MFNPTLNNIVPSFFVRTYECYDVHALTSQVFVAIALDSMILIFIFGLQLNVGDWAAVRQFTSKETPARGQDQLGNTFCWGIRRQFDFDRDDLTIPSRWLTEDR